VDVFQELRLRSGRVSNDAHIDVPSMTNKPRVSGSISVSISFSISVSGVNGVSVRVTSLYCIGVGAPEGNAFGGGFMHSSEELKQNPSLDLTDSNTQ
jgi:hypothetical protein